MEIKKIEKSDFVMLTRMQHRGLEFKHVEFDTFKAELRHVEGHGDYWLIHQQSKPHVVAHVQLPKTEAEFDNILGWCLGQNHWCEYIEGDLSYTLCSQWVRRQPLWHEMMVHREDCTNTSYTLRSVHPAPPSCLSQAFPAPVDSRRFTDIDSLHSENSAALSVR